jgi:hypothetical protein
MGQAGNRYVRKRADEIIQPRERLTPKEMQVAALVWEGQTNREIAKAMGTRYPFHDSSNFGNYWQTWRRKGQRCQRSRVSGTETKGKPKFPRANQAL